jgi:hypothetical protein
VRAPHQKHRRTARRIPPCPRHGITPPHHLMT